MDVVYTPCENLLKKKSFEVGQVAYKDEKLVSKTRIRDGRDNEIINRLNKTKKEVLKPDLEGEKIKRDNRIKQEKKKFYEQQEKEKRGRGTNEGGFVGERLRAVGHRREESDKQGDGEKYESYEEAEEDFM